MHDHGLFISTFAKVFISQLLPIITTWPLALETGVLSVPQIFFGNGNQSPEISTALQCLVWQFVVKGFICFSEVL